jgi:uncharacterized protein (DUF488 family)
MRFILSMQIARTDCMACRHELYTIGHSTRTLDEFLHLLKTYEIEVLADIRTIPESRRYPHFSRNSLSSTLSSNGIQYIHLKELGGLRRPRKDSENLGWRNESFRGYADYMQTSEFKEALAGLAGLAENRRTVIMCAEAVPWRCHRNLVADALTVFYQFDVYHIINERSAQQHRVTSFAVANGKTITYPVEDSPTDLFSPTE